jgi:hypothetical protein
MYMFSVWLIKRSFNERGVRAHQRLRKRLLFILRKECGKSDWQGEGAIGCYKICAAGEKGYICGSLNERLMSRTEKWTNAGK